MHRYRRRFYIKTLPIAHTSKNNMVAATIVMAVLSLIVAVQLPASSAIGVFVGVTVALLLRWAQWSKHH